MLLTVEVRGVRHMIVTEETGQRASDDIVGLRCGGYTHAPDAAPGVPTCLFCWGSLWRWMRMMEIAEDAGVAGSVMHDTLRRQAVFDGNLINRETT